MNIRHLPVYYEESKGNAMTNEYNILDIMKLRLAVTENRFDLPLDMLFSMAARVNRKRRFLFVSRVLGKHIPVENANSLLTGALLAYRLLEEYRGESYPLSEEIADSLKESRHGRETWKRVISNPVALKDETLFLAFAETATGLGHSVFSCFDNARFIHTTRDMIQEFKERIVFQEEHSHAVSHKVYPLDSEIFKLGGPVVFIDDEISTGKTVLNIIKEINKAYPGKEYIVLSILDFRSKKDRDLARRFEKEEGIRVRFISLVSGEFEIGLESRFASWEEADIHLEEAGRFATKPLPQHENKDIDISYMELGEYFDDFVRMPSVNDRGEVNSIPYLKATGRFGMDSGDGRKLHGQLEGVAKRLSDGIKGERILFLGTEEFIYIPLCLSSFIDRDIYFYSTTRSPIYTNEAPGYPVKNAFRFDCPHNPAVTNHVYNIQYGFYDELYIFFERGFNKDNISKLKDAIHSWGIKKVTILTLSGGIEG